ncbi:MAG: hypothetical protein NC389_17410 [Acetatifactor muris]|nr:hypothetical protein [Acetatifactor muris]
MDGPDRAAGQRETGSRQQKKAGQTASREKSSKEKYRDTDRKVNLLVDIQVKLRAGKGRGDEQWAKVFNLKEASRAAFHAADVRKAWGFPEDQVCSGFFFCISCNFHSIIGSGCPPFPAEFRRKMFLRLVAQIPRGGLRNFIFDE